MATTLSSLDKTVLKCRSAALLGLLIGCTYLAKVSLILVAVWVVLTLGLGSDSPKAAKFHLWVFAGTIISGAGSHLVWLWPARNQAIFGDVAISTPGIDKWFKFVSDGNFSVAMKLLSALVAGAFLAAIAAALLSVIRARKLWRLSLLVGGLGLLAAASILQFGAVGNGESYIWTYGTMLASMGLVVTFVDDRVSRSGRRLSLAVMVAGVAIGFASGLGFWVLRVLENGLLAIVSTAVLGAVLLSAVIFATSAGIRRRRRPGNMLNSKILKPGYVGTVVVLLVLGLMSGNYFGYAFRGPVTGMLSGVRSDASLVDVVKSLLLPKLENRPDFPILSELTCLNESTNSEAVFALDGVSGSAVLGVAQRALYFDDVLPGMFPSGHPMKTELDRRIQLVSAATRTGSSEAVTALRAEGVSFVLIGAAIDVPVEQRLWRKPGVCSSDDLFVWEL
jgi:hypothetical protein